MKYAHSEYTDYTPSDILAERLRMAMQTRGINAVQLAKLAGVKTSFLYDVLRKKSHNPSILRLAKVAEALTIPLAALVPYENTLQAHPAPAFVTISPMPYNQTSQAQPIPVATNSLGNHAKEAKHLRYYKVENDAMQPSMFLGDVVVINAAQKNPEISGIFLITEKGGYALRRIKKTTNASAELWCDNPAYSPEKRALARIGIAGRVIWLSRFI